MSSTERFALIVAVGLAMVVRLVPILNAAAATGDGGLFLAMMDDLRAAGLLIPHTTSFNSLDIPFLYPPLALLLGAGIGEVTGASSLDVLRWMPFVVSVIGVGAFAWLARRALPAGAAIGATFVYALMPHAYDWVIAGGGLTRGLGLLFALLACGAVAVRANATTRHAISAGALLGLSALAHPQAAIFGVIACLVLSWEAPVGQWVRRVAIAAGTALAVVLPWLIWIMVEFGGQALLSVGHRLDPMTGLIKVLNLEFSGAPFMDVFAVVGAVGLLASIVARQLRIPILLLATYLTGAGGGNFMGAVIWAMLGGIGAAQLMDLLGRAMQDASRQGRRVTLILTGTVILFIALIGSLASFTDQSSKLQALSTDHISAMRWLSAHSPPDTVVIVPTNEWWGDDEVSEWLPALSHRQSWGTVQGAEWLGAAGFHHQVARHIQILDCSNSAASCYASLDPDAWLFLPKGFLAGPFSRADCCPAARYTLTAAGYSIVFDGAGATIAEPRAAAGRAWSEG